MRNVIVGVCVFLTITLCTTVLADGINESPGGDFRADQFIASIYRQIDFGDYNHLSYDVFNKAYKGYLNLMSGHVLNGDKQVISVCDFSKPSVYKRLWVIDLGAKKVLFNTYVAHGQGSGEDGKLSFSNQDGTHKSSLGFYVTGTIYDGEHGTSLHLNGMDQGFNDAASDRSIVVHGADYVSDAFIRSQDRLGRSWGCPAVPTALSLPIINAIKGGTCLFIYYPDTKYLKTSVWLNKKVDMQPGNSVYADALQPASGAPRTTGTAAGNTVNATSVQ